jgi:MFS family permease
MNTQTSEKKNVLVLASMQALFQTASVMVMTISGLVGQLLAPDKRLATLPIALMVVAAASTMIPASLFMQKFGRKPGFILGICLGGSAGAVAAMGIWLANFWIFVVANMLVGSYQGFAQYYRFAAADSASENFKSRAISWVVAGGVVSALAGPNIARFTKDIGPVAYMAPYMVMCVLATIALLLASQISIPPMAKQASVSSSARPLFEIIKQPVFLTAVTGSSIGFSVMIMVMTATPLAMKVCGHPLGLATTVIQWHVLGMFAPSFFTGSLIRRFGVLTIMATGALLMFWHILFAITGTEFFNFVSGLVLLGIGWNFLFIGGTTLLTKAYLPGEQAKTQATHDFLMFSLVSIASFSAGGVLEAWGWRTVNIVALPVLCIALAAITGLALSWRRTQSQAAFAG